MTKCAEVAFAQHALDRFKYKSYLAAAPQNLFIAQFLSVFGFADAWDRQFAAFDTANIFGILLWTYKFVVAAPSKFQQVIEKLSGVGGANVVVQSQIADVTAEKDPELFVVENVEVALLRNEQVVAKGVKGFNLQPFGAGFAEFRLDALPHFVGGIDGVGDSKNLVGTSMSRLNQSGDAAR